MHASDRRDYFKQRYNDKRASGLCTKNGCAYAAFEGRTLCQKHTYKNRRAVQGYKRRDTLESRMRERLPEERSGTTLRFVILERFETSQGEIGVREIKGYLQTGEYHTGKLGEVFLKIGKPGSSEALLDQWGIAASIAIQYGAGVEELFGKHVGTHFEPFGAVKGVVGIERCTSVLDLVSRWLIKRYGGRA